jgi:hypothetical protein
MANTPRLDLRRPAGADTFNVASDIEQIVDIIDNAAIDQSGTLASRPAANSVVPGTYYSATDIGDLSRSDGTTWFTLTPGNRSSFQAHHNAVLSFADATATKVPYQTEVHDLGGDFDPAMGRFTAPVKGLYEFYGSITGAFSVNDSKLRTYIHKNGSSLGNIAGVHGDAGEAVTAGATVQVQLNASDYVEIFGISNVPGAVALPVALGKYTQFGGKLIAQLP